MQEKVKEHALWRIRKYASRRMYSSGKPYETREFVGNLLLNEGINELWKLCCGDEGTKWDETNARLGVGDSNTAETATQTGLEASTNKFYKAMDSGYPTCGTDQKVTFKATFGESDANFDWKEFTVTNAADDSGANLNRKVSAVGTKSSGQVWELSLEITLS